MKRCSRCHYTLPLEQFAKDRTRRDGLSSRCKACKRIENKQRTPERVRAANLKKQYGITPAQWDEMFEAQGRVCAICLADEPLHVDHNHATGALRELLCAHCNHGLGKFRENPVLLARAIDYLEKWNA